MATSHDASRLVWIDHLRAVLTVMVVAHHAAQAFGPTGGEWPVANGERSPLLGVFISVNAMYFMALFFFVSGYFTPAAFERKGARAFLTDRARRLGVPSLIVVLISMLTLGQPRVLHLWFAVDLLAVNAGYVAWQSFRDGRIGSSRAVASATTPTGYVSPLGQSARGPLLWRVLGLIGVLAVVTALLRLRYPVDRWVQFVGLLPIEPAHAPQYVAAFLLGVHAGKHEWLARVLDAVGLHLLVVSSLLVSVYALYRLSPSGPVPWLAGGGASLAQLRLSVLESAVVVTLGGGALWASRRLLSRPSRLLSALADDAYGIYCVHLPLVLLAQTAVLSWGISPLIKFFTATGLALALSWVLTRAVLRSSRIGRRVF